MRMKNFYNKLIYGNEKLIKLKRKSKSAIRKLNRGEAK